MRKICIITFIATLLLTLSGTNSTFASVNNGMLIAKIIDDDFSLDKDLDINSKKQIRPRVNVTEDYKPETTSKCVEKVMTPHIKRYRIKKNSIVEDTENVDIDKLIDPDEYFGVSKAGANKKGVNKKPKVADSKPVVKETKQKVEKPIVVKERVNREPKVVKEAKPVVIKETKQKAEKPVVVKEVKPAVDKKPKTIEQKKVVVKTMKNESTVNYTKQDDYIIESYQELPEHSFDTMQGRMPLTRSSFDEW